MTHTLKSFFKKLWISFEKAQMIRAQYMLRSSTIRNLSNLSDKQLRDIGLTRGEIYDTAKRVSNPEENPNLKYWV